MKEWVVSKNARIQAKRNRIHFDAPAIVDDPNHHVSAHAVSGQERHVATGGSHDVFLG